MRKENRNATNRSYDDQQKGIVYSGVRDTVVLSPEDFESEEEFNKWKEWIEANSLKNSRIGHTALWETMDYIPQEEPQETYMEFRPDEVLLLAQTYTSEKQYRRLWMYAVEKMTLREISQIEGVSIQGVRKSIVGARKRIQKVWYRRHEDSNGTCR